MKKTAKSILKTRTMKVQEAVNIESCRQYHMWEKRSRTETRTRRKLDLEVAQKRGTRENKESVDEEREQRCHHATEV